MPILKLLFWPWLSKKYQIEWEFDFELDKRQPWNSKFSYSRSGLDYPFSKLKSEFE